MSCRSKADKDPAGWLPPAESALCTYAEAWTATKLRWSLAAEPKEQTALNELAADCADSVVTYQPAP